MHRKFKVLTFLTLIICILFISCGNNGKNSKSSNKIVNLKTTSQSEVKEYSLEDFKGEPTILNFWASWCVPCRDEMPFLEESSSKLKNKGINLVGVNVMDDKDEANKTLNEFKITYLNLFDPNGRMSRNFGVVGLPATIFMDKDGKVKHENYGPFIGEQGEKRFYELVGEIL